MADLIDTSIEQWGHILPQVDTSPLAVVGRIRILAQLIQLASDDVLGKHGITRAEFDILSVLVRTARPMSPTEIASTSLTSAPGTSKRINKLIDSGLVVRKVNPRDGRGVFIHVTERARAVLEPVLSSISDFENELLSGLSDEAHKGLERYLREFMIVMEAKTTADNQPE
ncbi:MAG: hypothetical protein QOH55_2025 [Microbacteriaceae bacterium]|jgi:DNA-binding MarR family transcriptional regulator|nr:hypothetical protein [Microbacteriaceae bacterium]